MREQPHLERVLHARMAETEPILKFASYTLGVAIDLPNTTKKQETAEVSTSVIL